MTVTINGTSGVTFPVTAGSASPTAASPGKVLQVVFAETGDDDAFTTSTTFVDLASVSITPSSSNSKILIQWSAVYQVYGNLATTSPTAYAQVTRNGTALNGTNFEFNGCNVPSNSGLMQSSSTITWIDSPSSTSAITYKVQHKTASSARVGAVQNNFIMVMEIAA